MNEHDLAREQHDDELLHLYRAAAKPEPSALLDAAILAAARQATQGGAVRQAQDMPVKGGLQRWRIPFALAATVLLSVTVTTMVQQQQSPGTEAFSMASTSMPAAQDGSTPVAASVADAREQTAAKAGEANTVMVTIVPPTKQLAEPAAAPAYAPAEVAEPAPVPARMRERVEQGVATMAGAAAPADSAPAPAADAEVAASALREDKAMSVRAAPLAAEQRAFSAGLGGDARKSAAVTKNNKAEGETAERWIEDIRTLKRAGRLSEAVTKLAEFRRQFPDYVLPADLKTE